MNDLVKALKTTDGYRNQSLAILEYLESNGVVNCKKKKVSEEAKFFAAMAGQDLADDNTVWEFLLKKPSCPKYEDCNVRGAKCTENMCRNILQAVKEEKIKIPSDEAEAFVSGFISVIDLIFPEGQRDNINIYLFQDVDFGGLKFDPNNDRPSLFQIRECRRELFVSLIETLLNSVNMSVAINVFKKYSNKYGIKFRSVFVNALNDLFENKLAPEDLLKKTKDLFKKLKDLSDFDLRYLLSVIDAEQTNYNNRRNAYLKTVNKLCDAGWKLKSNTSCINPELLKEISDLDDSFREEGLNENQRYYLSILVREYDEFSFKPEGFPNYNKLYGDFLGDLRQNVEKILTDRENEYEKRLLEDFNKGESKFDDNELKNLFITFLKTCEKCVEYGEDYEKFDYNNVNYEALYEKVKNNDKIVKRIAAAQSKFSKVEDMELGEGDFTYLIAVQVKVIERYLKEVIAQNMTGEKILSYYKFKKEVRDTKESPSKNEVRNTKESPLKNEVKEYEIKVGDSAETLSSKKISIELATAGYIVSKIGWNECKDDETDETDETKGNDFFHEPGNNNFIAWCNSVRNGYFHIHPVENMAKAKEIHYRTAFCLMRCIYLLKPLER